MTRATPQAQRGVVAILFAVLIVSLCAVYAASLAWDSTLDARRSASLYWREQAVLVAVGAENWVGDILMTDLEDTETDHFGEFWALDLPPLPVDGAGITGELSGSLEDLQGRFNVNNLVDSTGRVDAEALEQFQRLLTVLEIDPRLAGIAADWIDADVEPSFPDGAEDPLYTGLAPAYRTANLPLSDASEFAALDGMGAEDMARLKPHIVALPGVTRINVNTATAAVLRSLDERIDAGAAERLIEERTEGGFADYQASFAGLVEPELIPRLGETSDFFRLRAVVRIGTARITMYSLLQRGTQSGVTPILRTLGTD